MAMSTPPMAGPMTRAPFMTTLFRLTALGRSSLPTISMTKVWRAGLSNMFTTPSSNDSRYTSHRWTDPAGPGPMSTRSPSSRASTPADGLGRDRQTPLVDPVGDESTPCAEQQHGQELQGRVIPRSTPRARREPVVHDEPRQGHALHPRAAHRDDLAR